ncbi:hypothetical protein [Paenibacillus sp. S150]|uniref:hypothetical protein n=1 Tax=Paenibacillus sp. S150 TaxID=2749826 RepID=UPI001C59EAF5|nr:hypothetical protein [Paenibacillus sp. S150]MBW4081965.1 hypothetical protein [Paenibacillus sp. S150]
MSVPSVSKPLLWWCAVLTVIILFCVVVYRTGSALYHNYQLRKDFSSAATASPYQQGIPLGQMDLNTYNSYFPGISAEPAFTLTHRIEAPVTLQYYTEIPTGETAVALEIPKGTIIVAIPEGTQGSSFYELGYGYTSYPTYEKGWRYVRPFKTTEDASAALSEEYYYVKLGSLEAVLDTAIRANKPFRAAVRQQHWTLDRGKHIFARYIDDVLYQNGAYLSPDLFYRVVDRWSVMLLGVVGGIVFFLLGSSLCVPRNRG